MSVLKYPGLQKYDSEIKGFINNHYEPKLRFDPTPIYNVTLAEDVVATSANPYRIELPPGISLCFSFFRLSAFSASGNGYIRTNDDASGSSSVRGNTIFGTSARYVTCWHSVRNGVNVTVLGTTTEENRVSSLYENVGPPAIGGNTITSIDFYTEADGPAISAGSQFIVYVAEEV